MESSATAKPATSHSNITGHPQAAKLILVHLLRSSATEQVAAGI
jgi:hypothetical protein